ncbi:MAG: hypothetical protein U0X73_15395 [Thermoanaerobaculia bacterium]
MRSRRPWGIVSWLAVGSLLVGLLSLRVCAGEGGQEVGVTPELAGAWTTTAPDYADRYLEIRPGQIVFGQGEAGAATYPILGVRLSTGRDGASIYEVRYQVEPGEKGEAVLKLVLSGGELHLASQPAIRWTVEH